MKEYFKTIWLGTTTVLAGMKITLIHMLNAYKRKGTLGIVDNNYFSQVDGLVTLSYPSEEIPVPKFARYRLYNEINDCIGCDQCAKACPVDCITIETIKSTPDEDLGVTADKTKSKKRLWLPVFDIDMAKCMYCGLCTYPCPTECLIMTPVYDFSEFDRENFIYKFGNMTPELVKEKKEKLAKYDAEKAAEKAKAAAAPKPAAAAAGARPAPVPAAGGVAPKVSPMMAARKPATPASDAPAETPKAETPSADAPKAETPATDAAKPAPKLSPMMAARLAAKPAVPASTDAPKAETPKAETPATDAAKPAPKLSPMMAARMAAKPADPSSAEAPKVEAPKVEAPVAKKMSPMMAAKLAAQKQAESMKKDDDEKPTT